MNHPSCSVTVLPDPRRKRAELRCDAPATAAIELVPSVDNCRIERIASGFTLSIPDAVSWTPENPHVYDVTLTIDGTTVEVPVGLRRFTLEEGSFRLNQRRIELRGASIDHADAISPAVDSGCNAVRLPIDALSTAVLSNTDATGTLVFASLGGTPDALDQAAVQAIRNHPSLAAWHARFRAVSPSSVEQFIEAVRRIDETRLILCEVTDDLGWPLFCRYANPHESALHAANIARLTVTAPMPGSALDTATRFGAGRAPAIVEAVVPERSSDTDTTLLEEAVADCVRAVRLNPNVAGYWFDGVDLAGRTHQAFRPFVQLDRVALRPREETGARVFLTPTDDAAARMEISLQVVGPTGQVLWKKKRTIPLPKSMKPVWDGTVGGSGQAGPHRFVVRIMSGGRIVGEDAVPFHVVADPEPAGTHVRVLGPPVALDILKHVNEEGEASVFLVPPMGNTIWGYPAEEISAVLAAVQSGAIAIVVAPPVDWNALADLYAECPHVETRCPSADETPASFHAARHPIAENLRTQDLLTTVYQRLRPARVMSGASDDLVIHATTSDAHEIIVRAFGEGRLVFVNASFLEDAGDHVAATTLLRNLVDFGGRRAVPGAGPVPPIQPILDAWRERSAKLRRWRVLGPFNEGARLPEPPSTAGAFEEDHEGAYGPASWRDWWVTEDDGMQVDCRDACAIDGVPMFGNEGMSAYAAYAFRSSVRTPVTFNLSSRCETRLWLNGRLVEGDEASTRDGGNVITVQCIASAGNWSFSLDYELGH